MLVLLFFNKDHETATYHTYLKSSLNKGAQWLSGRVLDLRTKGHMFEPNRRHCIVSSSKTHLTCLVLVQPRKTHLDITEKLLTGT